MRLQKRHFTRTRGPNRVSHRLTISILLIVVGGAAFLVVVKSWGQLASIWSTHSWLQWLIVTVSIVLTLIVGAYWFHRAKSIDRRSLIMIGVLLMISLDIIVWLLGNHQVISNSWSLDMPALSTGFALILAFLAIPRFKSGSDTPSPPVPDVLLLERNVEAPQMPEAEPTSSFPRKLLISYADDNGTDLAVAKQLKAKLRRGAYTPLLQAYQPRHSHSLTKELKLASKEAQYMMLIISQHYLREFTRRPLAFKCFIRALSKKRERVILIYTGACEKYFEARLARFDPISVVGKEVAEVYQELMKRISSEDAA